ncbi:CAP domain-containing protein [Pseudonocardia acaciae]|uniref:CAP domain-containing protein n=1 Tax=Pseudonocardia acaciae TaxID=551276 RepID=UPI0007E8D08E|nr:CAP domain-containing protein [Pseudonocardia acaciae]
MTNRGRQRMIPVLAGLGCGALVAVVAVVVGPRSATPPPPPPDVSASGDPLAVGPVPLDDASTAPLPPGGLGLPLPAPPPIAVPPPPGPPPPPPPPPKPATPGLSGPAAQMVALTNARRAAAGCKPLQVDSRLNKSAQRHGENMAGQGFFSHNDPSGNGFADRERAAGYQNTGGENIARGYKSASQVMNIWMNSPSHRENILRCEFKTIGIGYVPNGSYWVQNFGY